MVLQKKFIISVFTLLLLTILAVIFLSKNEVKKETKTKVKQEIKAVEATKKVEKKTPPLEENLTKKSPIDIMSTDNSSSYHKQKSETQQLMQDYQKINTYEQKKYSTSKKENWNVDYGVGLEDGSVEKLKDGESLKANMVNGKVNFSKSF